MLKQIKIHKLSCDIKELQFYTKCAACSMLHVKSTNCLCDFCKKYLHYVRETDLLLFTVKNFIMELGLRKEELNFSHHEFVQLENDLIEISDKNPAFTYNKKNMMWHIDFDFFHDSEKRSSLIFETCNEIYEHIFQESYYNKEIYELEKPVLKKMIQTFDSTKTLQNDERILMLNFPTIQMRCKYKNAVICSMFRETITRNFFENLSFYQNLD
jgi:hypothetical protein